MPDRKTSVGEPCARSGGYLKGGRGCETRELRVGKIRMAAKLVRPLFMQKSSFSRIKKYVST